MKTAYSFILLIALTFSHAMAQQTTSPFKIRHSVVFKLNYQAGSREENDFIDAALKLSSIPGVHRFECLRQVSKKNSFEFGISMEFDSMEAYDAYSKSKAHGEFIQIYWKKGVKDFMELWILRITVRSDHCTQITLLLSGDLVRLVSSGMTRR